jgi:hypothetical protein
MLDLSMSKFQLLPMLLLLSLPLSVHAQCDKDDQVCLGLQKIVAAGVNGFADVRGAGTAPGHFSATFTFPGFEDGDCIITAKEGRTVYSCSDRGKRDPHMIDFRYHAVAAALPHAFPNWSVKRYDPPLDNMALAGPAPCESVSCPVSVSMMPDSLFLKVVGGSSADVLAGTRPPAAAPESAASPYSARTTSDLDKIQQTITSQKVPDVRLRADAGDTYAELLLGALYADGKVVPKDDAQALRWYRKAADGGNPLAMVFVGFMYTNGTGVPKDQAEAVQWYQRSASAGDPSAAYMLGAAYVAGGSVPRDLLKAAALFRQAAQSGDSTLNALTLAPGSVQGCGEYCQWLKTVRNDAASKFTHLHGARQGRDMWIGTLSFSGTSNCYAGDQPPMLDNDRSSSLYTCNYISTWDSFEDAEALVYALTAVTAEALGPDWKLNLHRESQNAEQQYLDMELDRNEESVLIGLRRNHNGSGPYAVDVTVMTSYR